MLAHCPLLCRAAHGSSDCPGQLLQDTAPPSWGSAVLGGNIRKRELERHLGKGGKGELEQTLRGGQAKQ